MEQKAQHHIENPSEQILKKFNLKAGRKLTLIKRLASGDSAIQSGEKLTGTLKEDIRLGSGIYFTEGGNASNARTVTESRGKCFIQTQTSLYEVVFYGGGFEGLAIKTELGEVSLPADAEPADLKDEIVDIPLSEEGNDLKYSFYINEPVLKDILLEVHGGNLFRVIQSRFVVLAKVGNIHLPFYVSSAGTGGKKEGQWYPFFGYNGSWIVKGGIATDGEMYYHPEISRVQNILNQNLKFPAKYITKKGNFGTGGNSQNNYEPTKVYTNLNQHLHYQNVIDTEYKDKNETDFVERITGYNARKVSMETSGEWIKEIVSKIE